MLIGIDVGGTFTDGAIYNDNHIINWSKEKTDNDNLADSLLKVLDNLLVNINGDEIQRVVLSTTLVTNLITTDSGPRTALVLLPGPGLPLASYEMVPDTYFLRGSIDFRGNETEAVDKNAINEIIRQISALGITRIAIAGKFANRNNCHELLVKEMFAEKYPQGLAIASSEITQALNFPRRAYTAYLTAMTIEKWNYFLDNLHQAIAQRGITAPVHILKADGGTLPLQSARTSPCETIFSGPAASTMGGMALTQNESLNSVVLDIGGTTTDISLIIDGLPLYASKGARVNHRFTHIRSFAVRSIPLGGDSVLRAVNEKVQIGRDRVGPAACFGGEYATIMDAFNYLYQMNIGSPSNSRDKLAVIADAINLPIIDLCREVIDTALEYLQSEITAMFKEWEQEPAYRVWEIVNRQPFQLDRIIGIGAAAPVIIPVLADKMSINYLVHEYSAIANALGSAVSRPTLTVSIHLDTQAAFYAAEPGAVQKKLTEKKNWQMDDVKQLVKNHLQEMALQRGMENYADEAQFFREEQFNVIRGWDRLGKMFDVGIQITPGFINEFKGVLDQ